MFRSFDPPRRRLAAIVVPVGVAGVLAMSGLPGEVAGVAMRLTASATTGGQFTVQCNYSHTLKDDTIVFPGQPGASHSHDFYGNVTTDAGSTYTSMVTAGTTCTSPDDTAAYWQPTLLVNGIPVASNAERAYYTNKTKGPIRAFPAGLRMIAGNAHATGPQSTSVFYWDCAHSENAGQLTSPPQCTDQLRAHIIFPNCWDGENLDSPDHKSHMAYSSDGVCPADHPVALPRLTIAVGWNATPAPASVSLSSGPAYTMHADFLNSWHQTALESLVGRCLAAHVNCGEITTPVTGTPTGPAIKPVLAPAPEAPVTITPAPAERRATTAGATTVQASGEGPASPVPAVPSAPSGPRWSGSTTFPQPPWIPRASAY